MMNRVSLLILILVYSGCGGDQNTPGIPIEQAGEVREDAPRRVDSRWDTPPKIVYLPQPDFDPSFFTREDNVHVMLRITAEGIVDSAWIVKSLKYPELDSLSLATAYRLVFTPAKKDGIPIETEVEWPFVFRQLVE